MGKRSFPLSQEKIVTIKWIIALDDAPEDFLRQVGDCGITVITIDSSDIYRKFEELLQRINSAILAGQESLSIHDLAREDNPVLFSL